VADDGTANPTPFRDTTVQVILASTLMGVMGVSLISPALPQVRAGLGITEGQASLILSAFTLPGILMGPVAGVLADRYGRRVVVVPSLVIYGITGGAVLLANQLWTVLALRVVQGSAAAALITLAITLVGDAFEGSQRNAIMGLNGAVLSVGTGLYPLFGGALSAIDWRAPFALYLVGVPVGLFAYRTLEEPTRERASSGFDYVKSAVRALPPARAIVLYGTALAIFVLLYGGVLTILPFLLDEGLNLSSIAIGVVLGVPSIATAAASSQNGRLARRFSNGAILAAGVAALGVGLAGLSLAQTALQFGIAILPFGAGMGLAMPSLDTAISHLVPTTFRGGAMSLRTSMVRTGQTIGPPAFTAVGAIAGARTLLFAAGVAGLVLAASIAVGLGPNAGRA